MKWIEKNLKRRIERKSKDGKIKDREMSSNEKKENGNKSKKNLITKSSRT